jgi:pimeloyl-ACP methyl ester carboxylesterase
MDLSHLLDRHSRYGTSLTILSLALLCLAAACGSGPQETSQAAPTTSVPARPAAAELASRPTAPVDELVDVGPGRLHVRCTGSGDATVVLLAGFTGAAGDWAAVEPEVAATTRVCAYDRFGTGTSDPPPETQTFATQARDLRALLTAVGEPGPYVLVGHSFGGAEAVTFASRFRADVQGLLLLDASPSDWSEVVCSVPEDGSPGAAGFRQACQMQASPPMNPEHLDGPAAFAEVREVRSLGDLPMVVATAPSRGAGTEGMGEQSVRSVNDAWSAGQDRWASLSSDSRLLVVPDTSHYIQFDQPAVVIETIRELL